MLGVLAKMHHLGLVGDFTNHSYFDFRAVDRLINSNLAIIQLSSYLAKALTDSISSFAQRCPTLASSNETIARPSGANCSSFSVSAPPASANALKSKLVG